MEKETAMKDRVEVSLRDLELRESNLSQQEETWKREQEMVTQNSINSETILPLNVSGVTEGFVIPRTLLCSVPNTALEAMISGRHNVPKIDGKLFVNRNPKIFMRVLDYLRNNQ